MKRYPARTIGSALLGDFRVQLVRTGVQLLRRRPIVLARSFRLWGAARIEFAPGARLLLGTPFYGFADRHLHGVLRVRGRMRVLGHVKLAAGCRFDVLPDGVLTIGDHTYFSPNVQAVVADGLTIGRDCAIAWDVRFIDDDRHSFRTEEGVRSSSAPIAIGDRVWIGAGAAVFKGVRIADGCVVAGGAIVTRCFDEPDCLIGGVPAQVLKRGIRWE